MEMNLLWTCRTLVEHSKAEGEIEDDEGTFDVSRFFANRITDTGSEDSSLNGVVINGIDNDRGGEESKLEEEYIPELVNLSDDEDWQMSMEIHPKNWHPEHLHVLLDALLVILLHPWYCPRLAFER